MSWFLVCVEVEVWWGSVGRVRSLSKLSLSGWSWAFHFFPPSMAFVEAPLFASPCLSLQRVIHSRRLLKEPKNPSWASG